MLQLFWGKMEFAGKNKGAESVQHEESYLTSGRLDLNTLLKRLRDEEKNSKKNNLIILSGCVAVVVVLLLFISL